MNTNSTTTTSSTTTSTTSSTPTTATAEVKKPRLTTSAMIASIASEGQRTMAAPFGKALVGPTSLV
jgi:hypothetical protein